MPWPTSDSAGGDAPVAGGSAAVWARLETLAGEDRDAVLVPWQTCEFVTAAGRAWAKLPEVDRERSGWGRRLAVGGSVQLTLSLQVVPGWDAAQPAPGVAAGNRELFPSCVFTVAAGSAGCRMAAHFWEVLCREHGLDGGTGEAIHGEPTGNWRGFFRSEAQASGLRWVPHGLFADLDDGVIGNLASRPLLAQRGLLSGGLGKDYSYRDATGPAGEALCARALAFLDGHSSEAGSPSVILLFASLEGSAGCGLGGLMLARLRARFPAVPVVVVGVLPHAKPTAEVAVAWHAAMALQQIRQHAAAALLFSNDSLIRRARSMWDCGGLEGYAAANLLIAEALAAVTAPLRFGGADAAAIDPTVLLEALGTGRGGWPSLVTAHCWPLARLSFLRGQSPLLAHVMASAAKFAGRQKCFAPKSSVLGIFLRARWLQESGAVRRKVVSVSGRLAPGSFESLTILMESPEIGDSLARIAQRARGHLRRFPQAVAEAGLERGQLSEAILAIEARGEPVRRGEASGDIVSEGDGGNADGAAGMLPDFGWD